VKTRHAGRDATQALQGGAPVRHAEVPHLRLLRGRTGAQTEISLGVLAYNLKRVINVLGGRRASIALAAA
jgi:hypothetical protein